MPIITSGYPGNSATTSVSGDNRAQALLEAMLNREAQNRQRVENQMGAPVYPKGPGLPGLKFGAGSTGKRTDKHGTRDMERADNSVRQSPFGPKPSDFGRFQMNHTGNWGTMVDTANIPAGLQDKIMGGFHGLAGNWDTSNPSIMGPQQLATGKYTNRASGAGSGGSGADIGPGGQYVPGGEDPQDGIRRFVNTFRRSPTASEAAALLAGRG